MVMQKPSSKYGTNTAVALGTTDSVTVASDVTLVSTNSTAIYAAGEDQAAIIAGAVVSGNGFGVVMGSGMSGKGHTVTVTATGHVAGLAGVGGGIEVRGTGNLVTNHGSVEGSAYGVGIWSDVAGESTIINTGVIRGNNYAVFRDGYDTPETIILKNTGLIESANAVYGTGTGVHPGRDLITNGGRMIGDIFLQDGNDKYDGRNGKVVGEVSGGSGDDQLFGGKEDNIFFGDASEDKLYGGLGADSLTGGSGADEFIYESIKESTVKPDGRDTILDFSQIDTDLINLKAIDANTKVKGDQKFDFIDDDRFHGKAGELRFTYEGGQTLIQGDVDGDRKADFSILLTSEVDLAKGDFIL